LQAFAPDVLVLEAELLWGGGDGVLAVLDEEPELRPAVVILVSYAADRGLMHRVSRFKVDDYQMKPITAARLGSRIGKLLGPRGIRPETQAVPA
jgi:response regulator RpfG family c-di-GMP phosphodiesterase